MHRARPMLALAGVAFAVGAVVGAQHSGSPAGALAAGFAQAWVRGDYATMYSDVDLASRRHTSPSAFAHAYQHALRIATATRLQVAGAPRAAREGMVAVPVLVHTRLFGTLRLSFALKTGEEGDSGTHIVWSHSLTFPGLNSGEHLTRKTALPRRATLVARDGTVLAESPGAALGGQSAEGVRITPLGSFASAVLGTVGPVPASRRSTLEAEGVPPDALVGVSGLERALDDRLRGRPGGELLAAGGQPGEPGRVLAYAAPQPASPVRTTVSPAIQRAAVTALGGQYGGIVALRPSSGQILAVAGIGLDGLQPPGSTFKMVTLAGVLQARIAAPHDSFPYSSFSTLDGVRLDNANGENCGGSLELAFAVSCNSVFAPLGVELGAARLVATAEELGFNHDTGIPGAPQSTLPAPAQIQGELDLGSTAIGQGRVLATPLQMAMVAATIADGGRRPRPTFVLAGGGAPTRVMSAEVARTVRHMMTGVVRFGTGTSAAIPGVVVAGKTGTAELQTRCSQAAEARSGEASGEAPSEGCEGSASEPSNTDAWFAAFAPAVHPRIAVCVMLVKAGAGGDTAAPVAREVLEAGLHGGA
jgi:penicillin-binding protein A